MTSKNAATLTTPTRNKQFIVVSRIPKAGHWINNHRLFILLILLILTILSGRGPG